MDHAKKSVHSSGAIGMLLSSKQIRKVDDELGLDTITATVDKNGTDKVSKPSLYKTQSGIVFNENELIEIDPNECEPWKYANRLGEELGNIDELAESIRLNKQLQPVLIREHTNPHDGIRYEIIFGRRRYEACRKLGINLLAIKKNIKNTHDAILLQDAENKLRKDVSNYSNAILYKKLITDRVFQNESELANKIGIPIRTFNDLMTYSKIPSDIAQVIPDIHTLSLSLARKIISLLGQSYKNHELLLRYGKQIGLTINSPGALEKILNSGEEIPPAKIPVKVIKALDGRRLMRVKVSHRGETQIVLDKNVDKDVDKEDLYHYLAKYFEEKIGLSIRR